MAGYDKTKLTRADDGRRSRMLSAPSQILAAALICFAVLTPVNAYAYLDPGTGAFALQGMIAGIAGGMLSIRSHWKRIAGFFSKTKASVTESGRSRFDDTA